MRDMGDRSDDNFVDASIEAFLSQPAERVDEVAEVADHVDVGVVPTSWRRRMAHFFFEKKPSQYSSISPRTPDGRRTKPFFFNGNGRGR